MKKIKNFMNNWAKRKVLNGKSFDDLFKIEEIPLGWFYRRFFMPHIIPKLINPYRFIEKRKKINSFQQSKFYLISRMLSRYILINENKKIKYIKKKKNYTEEKKVLFLTYSNHLSEDGRIFRIQNIIQKIKKDRRIKELVIFADPLTINDYKKIANFDNIYQYYDNLIAKKSKIISKKLNKKICGLSSKSKNKLFQTDEILLWPYFKYAFKFYFSKEFLYLLILYYELFKKILEKENVRVVSITGFGSLFEKCLIAAAKQLKIPVIVIQHGMGKEDLMINPEVISPKKIAVFSDKYKKRLVKLGVEKEDVVVTGSVVYDEINQYIGVKKIKDKSILMITEPIVEFMFLKKDVYFKRITRILKEITKIKGVNISIKLHPRETHLDDYKKIIESQCYNNVKIYDNRVTGVAFYKLINECDSFVHFGSNAALEAMIIGRPIVKINMFDNDKHFIDWLYKKQVSLEVNYKGNIKKVIEQSFKDEKKYINKRDEIIKHNCRVVDGKASERVVSLIYKLAK